MMIWRKAAFLAAALSISFSALGQAPPVVKAFHPDGPMPSYDVATIKLSDPNAASSPSVNRRMLGTTMHMYIARAYGVPPGMAVLLGQENNLRVIGGPAWIDSDRYEIQGKASDELRIAMDKMSRENRNAEDRMMQQSLLAERFHLKVHFETREMQIFELVPAKGGLKITAVDAPPPPSGTPPPPPKPGGPMPAGMMGISMGSNGAMRIDARAVTVESFASMFQSMAPEISGRPVVDMTGFKGYFDVKEFRFLGTAPPRTGGGDAGNNPADPPDVPSLSQELEDKLGIKLVPGKGQVEVVVIDSIDRPTEN